MATIKDIRGTRWRDELLPAQFGSAEFHCETGGWEGGRRIVMHEFPKKELPYAEDMGRRAANFMVRGYTIAYPFNVEGGDSLYQRDYRKARDALQAELDRGGPAVLQLPTMNAMYVVCPRYRLVEEEKRGGFCVFDMEFQEYGLKLEVVSRDMKITLVNAAAELRKQLVLAMTNQARTNTQRATLGITSSFAPPGSLQG